MDFALFQLMIERSSADSPTPVLIPIGIDDGAPLPCCSSDIESGGRMAGNRLLTTGASAKQLPSHESQRVIVSISVAVVATTLSYSTYSITYYTFEVIVQPSNVQLKDVSLYMHAQRHS